MGQEKICTHDMLLNDFYKKVQKYIGIELFKGTNQPDKSGQGQLKSIFIYHALDNSPEQEFIIDIEIGLTAKTAVLYHIALPVQMRFKKLGTKMVIEIEKLLVRLGIKYISLPAEHHSTGFWLKMGYRFKYDQEQRFYEANVHRLNLHVAYELEKLLKMS